MITFSSISTVMFIILCIIWKHEDLMNLVIKVVFGLLTVWGYHTVWGQWGQ